MATTDSKDRERQLMLTFRVFAIGLALVQVWTFRHAIGDVDGISYLEMGDAYVRGDRQRLLRNVGPSLQLGARSVDADYSPVNG